MNPERLQEIIKPLEDLLEEHEFILDGEPMVKGAIRMAAFKRADGLKIDYALEVIKDDDKGPYVSDSEVVLSVKLYENGNPISLVEDEDIPSGSNMPATYLVKSMIEEEVKSKLRLYLLGYIG